MVHEWRNSLIYRVFQRSRLNIGGKRRPNIIFESLWIIFEVCSIFRGSCGKLDKMHNQIKRIIVRDAH